MWWADVSASLVTAAAWIAGRMGRCHRWSAISVSPGS